MELLIVNLILRWVEFVIKVVIVAVILVLFCEVMPKIFARHNNIRFAKDVGRVMEGYFIYSADRVTGW